VVLGEVSCLALGWFLLEVHDLKFKLVQVGAQVGREHVFTGLLEHDFVGGLLLHQFIFGQPALLHIGHPVRRQFDATFAPTERNVELALGFTRLQVPVKLQTHRL